MRTSMSRAVAAATVAVMVLGAAAVQPAAAADFGQAQMTRPEGLTDVSYRSNAAVLGAVGAVFGTIAGLAAANAYRDSHPYYPQGNYQGYYQGYYQPGPSYGGGYAYRPAPIVPYGGWHGGWHEGWHHHRG